MLVHRFKSVSTEFPLIMEICSKRLGEPMIPLLYTGIKENIRSNAMENGIYFPVTRKQTSWIEKRY